MKNDHGTKTNEWPKRRVSRSNIINLTNNMGTMRLIFLITNLATNYQRFGTSIKTFKIIQIMYFCYFQVSILSVLYVLMINQMYFFKIILHIFFFNSNKEFLYNC